MAHITSSVEYGIHCLLWLVDPESGQPSSRDLAELQGISPSFVAKIFPKLEKAGIVQAVAGVHGGYRLAKTPDKISVLDVVDALEGRKPLFECAEIRDRCAVYAENPPAWATQGVCAIHAVMLQAEEAMRECLARENLATLARTVERKVPPAFFVEVRDWLGDKSRRRVGARAKASGEDP